MSIQKIKPIYLFMAFILSLFCIFPVAAMAVNDMDQNDLSDKNTSHETVQNDADLSAELNIQLNEGGKLGIWQNEEDFINIYEYDGEKTISVYSYNGEINKTGEISTDNGSFTITIKKERTFTLYVTSGTGNMISNVTYNENILESTDGYRLTSDLNADNTNSLSVAFKNCFPLMTTTARSTVDPELNISVKRAGILYSYKADGTRSTVNNANTIWYDGYNSSVFYYCGTGGAAVPEKFKNDTTVTAGDVTLVTDNTIRKILYYGAGGVSLWSGFSSLSYSKNGYWTDDSAVSSILGGNSKTVLGIAYNATHFALSLANTNNKNKSFVDDAPNCIGTTEYLTWIQNEAPAIPDNFTVYMYNGGDSAQDMFFSVYEPITTGKATIIKESTDSTYSPSFEGIKYGIYTDSKCTALVETDEYNSGNTFTCSKDGTSETVTLESGTYYVKEISSNEAYSISSEIYTLTVTENNTTTLNVYDTPQMDPIGVLLRKISATGTVI